MKNRFPTILAQLSDFLPASGRPLTGTTRLRGDLDLTPRAIGFLSAEIERAWGIAFGDSQVFAWRTLDDVCASIADSMECLAA